MHVFFMGSTGCLMCFLCLKKLSFALFGERFIGKFLHYSSSKSAKMRNNLEASPVRRARLNLDRGARVTEETPKWIRLH